MSISTLFDDVTYVGILLCRKHEDEEESSKSPNKYHDQMLLAVTNKDELVIPRGKVRMTESKLQGAMRIFQNKTGLAPEKYEVLQELGFVMEEKTVWGPEKTMYWLAFMDEEDEPLILADEYKHAIWVPVHAIKNMAYVDYGKMKEHLGNTLDRHFRENGKEIQNRVDNIYFEY